MIKEKKKSRGNVSPGLFTAHNSPHNAQITSAIGGSLSQLTFPKKHKKGDVPTRRGGGTRAVVEGLSNSSRLRFLRELASINFSKIQRRVLFTTLTFPRGKWPSDPKIWKRNLQKFKQRLDRKYGKTSGFWRLELHGEDGSLNPHFHLLLVLDQPHISNDALADMRAFVANAWYCACGQISDNHLMAGSQVKRVRSRRDWDHLTRYIAKKEKLQDESLTTGRVWGVWSKDLLPVEHETIEISIVDAIKIRRWLRRLARKRRGMGPLLRQQVFIRYENMTRILNYLEDQEDKSGNSGVGDETDRYSRLPVAA